jgi:hypothetical protein
MKGIITGKNSRISLILALLYWIPFCTALTNIIQGSGHLFPLWLDSLLFPGYFLSFAMGYGGGTFWALIGQLLTLLILLIIVNGVFQLFRRT